MKDNLLNVKKEINRIQRRSNFPKDLMQYCKENRILILYGESDDLLEFRGWIYDEIGAYNGLNYKDIDENHDLYSILKKLELNLIWHDEVKVDYSWSISISSKFEHEDFIVMDEEEEFSIGKIIQL